MSNVVHFSNPGNLLRRKRVAKAARAREAAAESSDLSTTCQNARLRDGRRTGWNGADARRTYWRARLEFERAINRARSQGIKEATLHPEQDREQDFTLLAMWRDALVTQILTPAPDVAAITWKRSQLDAAQWRFTSVSEKRLRAVIAAEWHGAHPTRRKIVREERHARSVGTDHIGSATCSDCGTCQAAAAVTTKGAGLRSRVHTTFTLVSRQQT